MASQSVVVCAFLFTIVAVSATNVTQCPDESIENVSSKVHINQCKEPPCELKRNTRQEISIEFTPKNDIKNLKNSVSTLLLFVSLPFVDLDGASVCDKVFTDSGDKTGCPLKAGTTYTYKDSFPIPNNFPTIRVNVRWALIDSEYRDIVCFTVPLKIVR